MGRLRWLVPLGLLTLALVAPAPVAGASNRPSPPIKVHITLSEQEVVAGQPISGTVVFTNTTHRAVTVNTCALNGWLAVRLTGRVVDSYPGVGSLLVTCPPSIRLVPGPNRFPVKVITTYGGCVQPQPSGTAPAPVPICVEVNGRLSQPPLPAGRYVTKLHVVGLGGLTMRPNQVTVVLEAPVKAPELAPCAETPGTSPKLVTVPNVVGLSSSIAAFPLASACLNAGYANPVGTHVISESPVAGSQVPEYSSVILTTTGN